VMVDATPIEHGHLGHRGTLRWKLRVDDWVEVTLVEDHGPMER
jgi:hypothetical protein